MKYLCVLLFSINLFSTAFSQANFNKASTYLVNNQSDSAFFYFKQIETPEKAQLFAKVLFNFATYQDYLDFCTDVNFIHRIDKQNLLEFITQRVKQPTSITEVNLSYVKLQSYVIDFVANELELEDAVEISDNLKNYISQFEDKKRVDYQLADLYSKSFDILLAVIDQDTNWIKEGYQFMNQALVLGDTSLHLSFSILLANHKVLALDLEGYNDFMIEKYQLALKTIPNTELYYTIIDKLQDGLCYAGYEDHEFVKNLILELYSSKLYYHKSHLAMLQYLEYYLRSDSRRMADFLNTIGYTDFETFIEEKKQVIFPELNNDDACGFLLKAARILHRLEKYDESGNYLLELYMITKKVYSKELSEALADFKSREISKEKQLEIEREQHRKNVYGAIGIIVFVALCFTVFALIYIYKTAQKLKQRNLENEELIKDKDTLMKEIHHRVKNNFQLVSTLLELQSSFESNSEAKEKLNEGQARIHSFSLVHQKLYENNLDTEVNVQQYLDDLVRLVLKSAEVDKTVTVQIQANNTLLDVDTIIPLGLITNELLTNSCKYDFLIGGFWHLELTIQEQQKGTYEFIYAATPKSGVVNRELSQNKGLGTILITSLVKQLQGNLTRDFSNGARYQISFRDKLKIKKR